MTYMKPHCLENDRDFGKRERAGMWTNHSRQVQLQDKGLSLILTQTRKKQMDAELWALLREAGSLG